MPDEQVPVATPKLTKLELQIMETLWTRGELSIREIQESFPEDKRPAYTTIQTVVYRLETKQVLKRVKKVGNFQFSPRRWGVTWRRSG